MYLSDTWELAWMNVSRDNANKRMSWNNPTLTWENIRPPNKLNAKVQDREKSQAYFGSLLACTQLAEF